MLQDLLVRMENLKKNIPMVKLKFDMRYVRVIIII